MFFLMNQTVNHLITQYGLLGVFLSAALEGELSVLIGGTMAHLGKLNPLLVTLVAWIAAFLSAQVFFYVGRSQRDSNWVHKVTDRRAFVVALRWIDSNPTLFCMFYRFIYGMRITGAVAISLSEIKARTFLIFNFFTALGWAVAGVALGWFFGPELTNLVRSWFTPQRLAIVSVVALVLFAIVSGWRARKTAKLRANSADAEI
jgi:membrane protein DedA with SNARE-associated domain